MFKKLIIIDELFYNWYDLMQGNLILLIKTFGFTVIRFIVEKVLAPLVQYTLLFYKSYTRICDVL